MDIFHNGLTRICHLTKQVRLSKLAFESEIKIQNLMADEATASGSAQLLSTGRT